MQTACGVEGIDRRYGRLDIELVRSFGPDLIMSFTWKRFEMVV